jgi:hypothetical protein
MSGNPGREEAEQGWRFGLGIALIVGGYGFLLLIPLVTQSDLSLAVRGTLTGLLAISPPLTKIAAVAVMGRPGFELVRRLVARFFGQLWPLHVSRARHRVGLSLFMTAVVFHLLLPYFPGYLVDWKANAMLWSVVGDAGMICGVFLLGGGFWIKVVALFRHDDRDPEPAQERQSV